MAKIKWEKCVISQFLDVIPIFQISSLNREKMTIKKFMEIVDFEKAELVYIFMNLRFEKLSLKKIWL